MCTTAKLCFISSYFMTGRVCVVTGGCRGLGYQTAWYLAEGGNDVILACRDNDRGENAAKMVCGGVAEWV